MKAGREKAIYFYIYLPKRTCFLPDPCKGCGFGGVRAGLGHRTHIFYKDRLGLFHWEPSRVDVNIQMDEKFKLKAMCVKFRGEKRTMCPSRRTERCPGGAQDPTRTAALQSRRKGSAEHLPLRCSAGGTWVCWPRLVCSALPAEL